MEELKTAVDYIKKYVMPTIRKNPLSSALELSKEWQDRAGELQDRFDLAEERREKIKNEIQRLDQTLKFSDGLERRMDFTDEERQEVNEMKKELKSFKDNLHQLDQQYDRYEDRIKQKRRDKMANNSSSEALSDIFPHQQKAQKSAIKRGLDLLKHDYERFI